MPNLMALCVETAAARVWVQNASVLTAETGDSTCLLCCGMNLSVALGLNFFQEASGSKDTVFFPIKSFAPQGWLAGKGETQRPRLEDSHSIQVEAGGGWDEQGRCAWATHL